VGTGKTVTATGLSLTVAGAANYPVNTTATTTANITAATDTLSLHAALQIYDGTTAATILTRTLSGVLGADVVTATGGTATFSSKTVGTAKTVTATGLSISGVDAVNYVLSTTTATTTPDITALTLTGSVTASN